MADNILEVKDLAISFRTTNGQVKAVRNISFNLERGKTLAIVGESGSGKSVTSKAILGILAGNSIVESGEILYDGKDLLRIDEEDMHKIRGDKISMIFQDPLSSLNPIVKIGKQIIEAMLLKNKANRKMSKKEFNQTLELLKTNILEGMNANEVQKKMVEEKTKYFDDFNIKAIVLENAYNASKARVIETISDIDDFEFMVDKKQKVDYFAKARLYDKNIDLIKNEYLTFRFDQTLDEYKEQLKQDTLTLADMRKTNKKLLVTENSINILNNLRKTLQDIVNQEEPNFFRIGYYLYAHPEYKFDLHNESIESINEKCLEELNNNFMNDFIELIKIGITNSYNKSLFAKKKYLEIAQNYRDFFSGELLDKKQALLKAKELYSVVNDSIDKLEINRDSNAYTFEYNLITAINRYFLYTIKNPKEEARFAKESAKRDALIKKGKNVDWKVVPKNVLDLGMLKNNIIKLIDNLVKKYTKDVSVEVDFELKAVALIDFFKDKASQVVYKLTKKMAKEKAIKLMEEVGIPEARLRYYQYPFEFSGGMRQRIVIAIALSANPDILICDEPTTALDVTIQAQILELINNLKKERNLSVIFITHDLGVVANMADDIAVMYAGKIVEYGTVDDIFYDPRHPYTWALLSSMPDLDTNEKLDAIPGTPPNMIYPPVGDAFAARNKYALKIDFEEQPPMFKISDTHKAATWLLHPQAPKVEVPKIVTERIARMKKLGGEEDGKQ